MKTIKTEAGYVSECGRVRIERDGGQPGWVFWIDGALNPFLWRTLGEAKMKAAELIGS